MCDEKAAVLWLVHANQSFACVLCFAYHTLNSKVCSDLGPSLRR